jgi:hypothetical protein
MHRLPDHDGSSIWTSDKISFTDNTMAKRRRTDNTMAKRKRTDNTMAKRKRTNYDLQNIHIKLKIE